jgi:hypothetical protein
MVVQVCAGWIGPDLWKLGQAWIAVEEGEEAVGTVHQADTAVCHVGEGDRIPDARVDPDGLAEAVVAAEKAGLHHSSVQH